MYCDARANIPPKKKENKGGKKNGEKGRKREKGKALEVVKTMTQCSQQVHTRVTY